MQNKHEWVGVEIGSIYCTNPFPHKIVNPFTAHTGLKICPIQEVHTGSERISSS